MENSDTIKIPRIKINNYWKLSTIVLIILVIFLFYRQQSNGSSISPQKAGEQMVNYLNERTGGGVSYNSYKDLGNLYEITVDYQNNKIPVYVTKDGNYFVQTAIPIDGQLAELTDNQKVNNEPIEVSEDDDEVLGDSNAKVTVIEFSDYQCPFCKKFYEETLPQLKKDYINTGKVKLIYRDYPLSSIHPKAQSLLKQLNVQENKKNIMNTTINYSKIRMLWKSKT